MFITLFSIYHYYERSFDNQTLEKTKGEIQNGQSRKNRQHWVHKTHDKDKQNKKQKMYKMNNTDPPKTGGKHSCS